MSWLIKLLLLYGVQGLSSSQQFAPIIKEEPQLILDEEIEKIADSDPVQDENLLRLSTYLAELLLMPWNSNGLPLIYVEEDEEPADNSREMNEDLTGPSLKKRSRYYRKYPWKRQNSRQTYDAENRYLCQPSKDDVYRLLVALHETRQGNRGHMVNFCNRKRPATAIFTNIRFLG